MSAQITGWGSCVPPIARATPGAADISCHGLPTPRPGCSRLRDLFAGDECGVDPTEAVFAQVRQQGSQWASHRKVINGILFRTRTGVPWWDLPVQGGRADHQLTYNFRAMATRYDKRAYVFHGTVTVAALRLRLRSRSAGRNLPSGCPPRPRLARPGPASPRAPLATTRPSVSGIPPRPVGGRPRSRTGEQGTPTPK